MRRLTPPRTITTLALLVALCACGRLNFDAENGDGSSDGDGGVAFSGPASLTLLDPGGPIQARSIVFHNPDGSIAGIEQTGPSGIATHDVSADGMITITGVINSLPGGSGGSSTRLYTIMGVQPGDSLVLGRTEDPWDIVGAVDVTLPGPVAGAAAYGVDIGCDQSFDADPAKVHSLELYPQCFRGATTFDVIAYAVDGNDNLLQFAAVKNVSVINNSLVKVAIPAWTSGTVTTAMNLGNAPATAGWADVKFDAVAGGVSFYADSDGDGFDNGSPASLSFDLPSGWADGIEYLLCVYHQAQGGTPAPDSISYIFHRQSGVPAQLDHDLSTLLLPVISSAQLDAAAAPRATMAFTPDGDLSAADGGLAVISWEDAQRNLYEWWIMFPPGQTDIMTPELPDFLADHRPSPSSQFRPIKVAVVDGDFIDGYDDMRNAYGFNFVLGEDENRDSDWLLRASSGPGGFFE